MSPSSDPVVLALESSCDETAAAVVRGTHVISSVVSTQIEVHRQFGGVVPELASRHHLGAISEVAEQALARADVSLEDIDAIAVTEGPGLSGALLVAVTFAVLRVLRTRPYLAVGWFVFLGMLVPVIGVVQVGMQAHADRYMYLPLGASRSRWPGARSISSEPRRVLARLLQRSPSSRPSPLQPFQPGRFRIGGIPSHSTRESSM